MYNPLALINRPIVDKMIEAGCRWWVRQSYPRGLTDDAIRKIYLFTYYNNDHDARVHYDIIKHQTGVAFYDTELDADRNKLYIAAAQPEGFKVCINQTEFEWEPPKHMHYKLQAYVRYNLKWKTQRGGDKIAVTLTTSVGDKFLIVFKHEGMEHAIALSDFETRYLN